ncbi:MAG: protease inhibitor I42 family protein [Anaerolineae bacterium]
MKRVVVVMMAVTMLIVAGCGTSGLTLGANESGTNITVAPGQVFTITLNSNPSTGYSWYVVGDLPDLFEQVGEPVYKAAKASRNLVGGGGTLTLKFKAVKAGTAVLNLGYMRSWEEQAPAETFTVNVKAVAK